MDWRVMASPRRKSAASGLAASLELVPEKVERIRELRAAGTTVPGITRETGFSKASVYRALG